MGFNVQNILEKILMMMTIKQTWVWESLFPLIELKVLFYMLCLIIWLYQPKGGLCELKMKMLCWLLKKCTKREQLSELTLNITSQSLEHKKLHSNLSNKNYEAQLRITFSLRNHNIKKMKAKRSFFFEKLIIE